MQGLLNCFPALQIVDGGGQWMEGEEWRRVERLSSFLYTNAFTEPAEAVAEI
jgi:hypothetical protein